MLKKIGILAIGDELLLGQTIDSNSAFMGKELARRGLKVVKKRTIVDQEADIVGSLREFEQEVDLVLITGGLGPTKDDITKRVLTEYFQDRLVLQPEVEAKIRESFAERGIPFLPVHTQQAMLPENATILPNRRGTASGMWFTKEGFEAISMPGVPGEMKVIFMEEALPRILERAGQNGYYFQTVVTHGIGESSLAERIEPWETEVRKLGMEMAYLPKRGAVKLRIACDNGTLESSKQQVQDVIEKLIPYLGHHYLGVGTEDIAELAVQKLLDANLTIACAESCTGGLLMKSISDWGGVSSFFLGGIVAYSNDVKRDVLKVSEQTLAEHGAVSKATAEAMAIGVQRITQCDIAISITGIAGPSSDESKKKPGIVYICILKDGIPANYDAFFPGSRVSFRDRVKDFVLSELVKLLP